MHCLNYTCKQYSTVNAMLKKCRQGVNRYMLINPDAMISGELNSPVSTNVYLTIFVIF